MEMIYCHLISEIKIKFLCYTLNKIIAQFMNFLFYPK